VEQGQPNTHRLHQSAPCAFGLVVVNRLLSRTWSATARNPILKKQLRHGMPIRYVAVGSSRTETERELRSRLSRMCRFGRQGSGPGPMTLDVTLHGLGARWTISFGRRTAKSDNPASMRTDHHHHPGVFRSRVAVSDRRACAPASRCGWRTDAQGHIFFRSKMSE
jgi:hypothetical protein